MAKQNEINVYHDSTANAHSALDRDFVRNVLLGELSHFRSYMAADWGGFGSGNSVGGTGLFGFFAKQKYGSYYQSPHALHGTQATVDGNDFARIFVDGTNDPSSETPSAIFDLPQFTQKLAIESQGPGLVYNTLTAAFAEGEKITGGTTGATAYISADFPDGTDGTLYLYTIVGNFNDGEVITGNLGGSATITRMTVVGGNPAAPSTFGKPRINAIQRFYGVGGEEVQSGLGTGTIFTFWGAIDNFCPQRLFTMPASLAGTTRDVELIPAFAQEGFTYVRLGTPNALRIYINGAWATII